MVRIIKVFGEAISGLKHSPEHVFGTVLLTMGLLCCADDYFSNAD